MLILPGGTAWGDGQNGEAAELAAKFISIKTPVAAICGATVGLAKVGLLDKTKHTSNSQEYLAATNYKGATHYIDAPTVLEEYLITASASRQSISQKRFFPVWTCTATKFSVRGMGCSRRVTGNISKNS